jgi:hypothetical protein
MPTVGTYRAVEFCTLAAATFNNVINADLSARQWLFPRASRAADRAMLLVAVTVAVAIGVSEAPMRTVAATLYGRSHALAD